MAAELKLRVISADDTLTEKPSGVIGSGVNAFIREALEKALPVGGKGCVEVRDLGKYLHENFKDEKGQSKIELHQCNVRVYNFLKSSKEFVKDVYTKYGKVAIRRAPQNGKKTEGK